MILSGKGKWWDLKQSILYPVAPTAKGLKLLLQRDLQSYLLGERFSGLSTCSHSGFSPSWLLSSISSFWSERNFGKILYFICEGALNLYLSFPPFLRLVLFLLLILQVSIILSFSFSFLGFPQPFRGSVTVGPSCFL